MAWTVWGETYDSDAQLTNAQIRQAVRPNKNMILKYVRTWVVFYGNPTFTSLNMKIYAYNESGSVGKLLHTSTNSLTKAQCITLDNGAKELYFEFDEITLNKDTYYYFALSGVGPSFSSTSTIAWMKAYPDPVYSTGLSLTYHGIALAPYALYFIGDEL